MKSLVVARECQRSALPAYVRDMNEHLTIVGEQLRANASECSLYPTQCSYVDQSTGLYAYLNERKRKKKAPCPSLHSDLTTSSYTDLVSQTYTEYVKCVNSSLSPGNSVAQDVDAPLARVNIICLHKAVANLTTPTISVIITVRRATACEYGPCCC